MRRLLPVRRRHLLLMLCGGDPSSAGQRSSSTLTGSTLGKVSSTASRLQLLLQHGIPLLERDMLPLQRRMRLLQCGMLLL